MLSAFSLRTPRLLLRPWRDEDRAPFAALNADVRVMQHFPSVLTTPESDAMVERIQQRMEEKGFGLWAVEVPGVAPFVGFIGLGVPRFEAHFTPCVEVGWRLAHAFWGRGYATEGALAALRVGFEDEGLPEVVSMTVQGNLASRRVMEKLGMHHTEGDDFDHPTIAEGSPLRRHVLYRMSADAWRSGAGTRGA